MIYPAATRFIILFCYLTLAAQNIWTQDRPLKDRKVRLLATTTYLQENATRVLSLWEIPLVGGLPQFTTRPDGKPTVTIPPNTAFVLIDGTTESPFAGNLVWFLKSPEAIRPQDLIVRSGSIVWHSGQQRAYVAISRSGASWARLQVYQLDVRKSLAIYSPASVIPGKDTLDSLNAEVKSFAEWKSDNLIKLELLEVDTIQSLVEPESILLHLVDEHSLQRINIPSAIVRKGIIDLRLYVKDGTWSKAMDK